MPGKNLKAELAIATETQNLDLPENVASVIDKTHGEVEDFVRLNYREINLFGSLASWVDMILSPVDPKKLARTIDILIETRSVSMNLLDQKGMR